MPKVEVDPARAAAVDEERPSSPKVNRGHTVPDEIPAVHVLEAAQYQDRKETQDLLLGFDRPGRSRNKAPVERDFVDYYATKKSRGAGGSLILASPRAEEATVLRPRKRERKQAPAWLGWAGIVFAMLGIGGAVAYVATSPAPPPPRLSEATTTRAAMPREQPSRESIPLPEPARHEAASEALATGPLSAPPPSTTSAAATTARPAPGATDAPLSPPPRASRRQSAPMATNPSGSAPAHGTVPPAASTAAPKPPPRDDFIREM